MSTTTGTPTQIQATRVMVLAVNAVRPQQRRAAMACAERAFIRAFNNLETFGDFSRAENIRLAGDAAAAEVAYQYAKR